MRDEYQGITIYNNNVFSPKTEPAGPTAGPLDQAFVLFFIGVLAMPFLHLESVIIFWVGCGLIAILNRRKERKVARARALRMRAEQENKWAMRGDPRGTYGQYPFE